MNWLMMPIRFFLNNKKQVLVFIMALFVWAIIIFPFEDLTDFLGTKIAEFSQNQLFVRISSMKISAWPPGIKFSDVNVDTLSTGTLTAEELTVSPSPLSFFGGIPSGGVSAHGFLHGDIDISLRSGSRSENGNPRQKLEVHAAHLNLQDLHDAVHLPLALKGQVDIDGNALADLTFADQPEADIVIKAEKFELPSQTINTPMGPINIPDMKMSSIELRGHMAAGKIIIEDGFIGKEGDEIHGTIKGDIMLNLQNRNGFQAQTGAYNLDIDLMIKSNLEDRLNLFLVAVSQFKTVAGDSSHYKFKVSGLNSFGVPSISALH